MPRVSVIIVNYNRWQLLRACLNGLVAQTWRDLEVIVVDNGSTDGSPEQIARTFPFVRLIPLRRNTGFCEANNRAIAIARGEFIALLNNDAVPDSCWLEELIRAADAHPEYGFFASRVLRQDNPTLLDSAGDGITLAGTAYRRGHLQPASRYARAREVFGASGAAAFYRRTLFDTVGLFDEDFFAVYEDADQSCRAQLAGYSCLYVPTAIVYHKGSSTIGRFTEFYVYQTQRNVEYFFLKNVPSPLIYMLFPFHLFYNLMGLVFFSLFARQGVAFLRAKRDALRDVQRVLLKRKMIQAQRRVPLTRFLELSEFFWPYRIIAEKMKQMRA